MGIFESDFDCLTVRVSNGDSPLPVKPSRHDDDVMDDRPVLADDSDFRPRSASNSGVGYTREFSSQVEMEVQDEDGFFKSTARQLFESLFDDEFSLDRYASFKSATSGFLLLTLFTQNCTQLRLLVLTKNSQEYSEQIHLWRALIFFMSLVIIFLVIAAVILFFISLLPLDQHTGHNRRILVRLSTILATLVAITCLLNVFCTTLIFAESKESIYLNNDDSDDLDDDELDDFSEDLSSED